MKMFCLQLRNEVLKVFAAKRTYIGFLMFLLAQNVIILLFRFAHGPRDSMIRRLEANGYPASDFMSGLTVAVFILGPLVYILLPLYLALTGGDLVAKEAEDGTLRMALARPISRWRFLGLKWLAGVVFSCALVAALGVFGLTLSHLWFPRGGLFAFMPGEYFSVFDEISGLKCYLMAHVLMTVKAVTILSMAMMFSCFNVKPAAATVLALSFAFLNFILQNLPFFKELQPWFLTYHLNLWQLVFEQPVPWWRMAESLSLLTGFNGTFLVIGACAFHVRDLKN
jgi:ABC-2 type transport system permease protein